MSELNLNKILKIAKRENNIKRNFLLINSLQGKHMAVSPKKAFDLFETLVYNNMEALKNEEILVIGFAETATAIATYFAIGILKYTKKVYLLLTTREKEIEGNYIVFSEEHSHATEQRIYTDELENKIEKIDRIIFIEDEITTGKTILNLKSLIDKKYLNNKKYIAVSILNGMKKENIDTFKSEKISINYTFKILNNNFDEILKKYSYSGRTKEISTRNFDKSLKVKKLTINGNLNLRKCIDVQKYKETFKKQVEIILNSFEKEKLKGKKVLIIGTEEFMYLPLFLSKEIEKNFNCKEVKFHATTRSPILPSLENDYPIKSRFELESLYEKNRKTFIYNLAKYDEVFIVTDSKKLNKKGINSLLNALYDEGNKNISIIQCKEDE